MGGWGWDDCPVVAFRGATVSLPRVEEGFPRSTTTCENSAFSDGNLAQSPPTNRIFYRLEKYKPDRFFNWKNVKNLFFQKSLTSEKQIS